MSWGEWLAFGGFSLAVLGGIVNIVWLLATMRAKLNELCGKMGSMHDDVKTNQIQLVEHGNRLVALESRPR